MTTLVVSWDSNINEFGRRVSITESYDGNVDIGSLLDSLGVGAWISNYNKAGLLEGAGDVVGEITRSKTTGDCNGSRMGSKFQDSALTVGTGRDHTDIGWVVHGCNNASCENDLFPRMAY